MSIFADFGSWPYNRSVKFFLHRGLRSVSLLVVDLLVG
jgi:hypothetical protein